MTAGVTAGLDEVERALEELSGYLDCGCVPCTGLCWDKESLREEIFNRADTARRALRILRALPRPGTPVCDNPESSLAARPVEPDDVYTRATRAVAGGS